jgi:hypothetical protein
MRHKPGATPMRMLASLGWLLWALPITCAQSGSNDVYTGGVTPSQAGRINPAEPNFVNGGNGGGGGGR